jgi:hypothetical protein
MFHRIFVNVQFVLVAFQSIMCVLVSVSQGQIYVADWCVFQDGAPRVRTLVRSLYSFGDSLLIGFLALISKVDPRQVVRAFLHTCAVADSHSRQLMEWASQLTISIIHHYTGELISCISVG